MANSESNVATERCANIRWKELHVYGSQAADFQPAQPADPICWCVKTQHALGPDGNFAHLTECNPGRSCYKPL